MTCAKWGEVWRMSHGSGTDYLHLTAFSQLLTSSTAPCSSALECDHTTALSPCWCCLMMLLLCFPRIYGEICQERAELWGSIFISQGSYLIRNPLCICQVNACWFTGQQTGTYTCAYLHMYIHRGAVALNLHPRSKNIIFQAE